MITLDVTAISSTLLSPSETKIEIGFFGDFAPSINLLKVKKTHFHLYLTESHVALYSAQQIRTFFQMNKNYNHLRNVKTHLCDYFISKT